MPNPLDDYLRDAPPAAGESYLQLQRAALQEVLKISATAVEPAETQIRERFEHARIEAQHERDEAAGKIAKLFTKHHKAIQQQYDEQAAQIQGVYEADLRTLKGNSKSTKERIQSKADSGCRHARKELDEKAWMVDVVTKSTLKNLKEHLTRKQHEVGRQRKRIEEVREQAERALEEYGCVESLVTAADIMDPQAGEAASGDNADFDALLADAEKHLAMLQGLFIPGLVAGGRLHVLAVAGGAIAAVVAGVGGYLHVMGPFSAWMAAPPAFVLAAALTWAAGRALRKRGAGQVAAVYSPLSGLLQRAGLALDRQLEVARQAHDEGEAAAVRKRDEELQTAKADFERASGEASQERDQAMRQLEAAQARLQQEIENRRQAGIDQITATRDRSLAEIQQRRDQDTAGVQSHFDRRVERYQGEYDVARARLVTRWREAVACVERLIAESEELRRRAPSDWEAVSSPAWKPTESFTRVIPIGHWRVDLDGLADGARELAGFARNGATSLAVPALLTLPDHCSLLVQADRQGRAAAIQALRAVMLRLLVSMPPGRARFTIIDPVGLGESFAGFMHLADYQEALVGGRIWTDSTHIEHRLADLTNHMENVIQKYLRNEFDTIDAYNQQAGELAEPYRFLVVADFPAGFNEGALRRLSSIISSGARCGVFTLIAQDVRQPIPSGLSIDDLAAGGVHLIHDGERFVWQDEIRRQFPLIVDGPPPEEALTRIMHHIGRRAKDALRVEVPFEAIAPAQGQRWTRSSSDDLSVPIGRCGAVRLQELTLGKGVAQHTLIAGKTGSGKSTLLHVIVTNLAMWYSPREVEFYLVDFKKGVEFKTYATHELPHARAVAVESDREFGLSVLQRIDQEMERRGELFRKAGVQDLPSWRAETGEVLPRTLLIVDEFQVFFSEDDKLAQDAALLLDRLVRQGRAFGIHVILGSQTLGGAGSLSRSTIGQMAVRIALQCSEADSQLILDDSNVAARLLSRPGEAVYNDAGGLVQGNSPFQTSWLSDEDRDVYLESVKSMTQERGIRREPCIVFEGNAPADVSRNRSLNALVEAPAWPARPSASRIWLGEAVAIKEPTSVLLRRQSGSNLLMIGQREDASLALSVCGLLALAAQHAPADARFVILDGSPTDMPQAGVLEQMVCLLPHSTHVVAWRDVPEAIGELAALVQHRQDEDHARGENVYLFVYGLQRYRMLRKSEDEFSFSRETDAPPDPGKQFADVLREGPHVGVHTIVWCDTHASLTRTLDRPSIGQFDHRLLFQMSATDSSNLIDSPLANRLGFHRALLFSEEQGVIEKLRPYALPDRDWLEHVRDRFGIKVSG